MKLAANLTFLFGDAPTWEKIDAAADAGFSGVEMLQPFDEDPDDLRHTLEAAGPSLVLVNTFEPKWDAGGRGYAALSGAEDTFKSSLRETVDFAKAAACPRIHLLAGRDAGDAADAVYRSNLGYAADEYPECNFTIEPLNAIDQPGYFLSDFEYAIELLQALGRPNLGLQFDTYHAQKNTGDAADAWSKYQPFITHVQVAGQDRGIPGEEEISLVKRMWDDGYAGWVSAEYVPAASTDNNLEWVKELI